MKYLPKNHIPGGLVEEITQASCKQKGIKISQVQKFLLRPLKLCKNDDRKGNTGDTQTYKLKVFLQAACFNLVFYFIN